MHFKIVNMHHDWMSNVDKKTGYGSITREDFVKLMEAHGFRVNQAETLTLNYKLSRDFVEGFKKKTILPAFPEIVGKDREEFFKEYIDRADKMEKIVSFDI